MHKEIIYNAKTKVSETIEREFTAEEISQQEAQAIEQAKQVIYNRLRQIDTGVCQARVIADIVAGTPLDERVTVLLAERETLIISLNEV